MKKTKQFLLKPKKGERLVEFNTIRWLETGDQLNYKIMQWHLNYPNSKYRDVVSKTLESYFSSKTKTS